MNDMEYLMFWEKNSNLLLGDIRNELEFLELFAFLQFLALVFIAVFLVTRFREKA